MSLCRGNSTICPKLYGLTIEFWVNVRVSPDTMSLLGYSGCDIMAPVQPPSFPLASLPIAQLIGARQRVQRLGGFPVVSLPSCVYLCLLPTCSQSYKSSVTLFLCVLNMCLTSCMFCDIIQATKMGYKKIYWAPHGLPDMACSLRSARGWGHKLYTKQRNMGQPEKTNISF